MMIKPEYRRYIIGLFFVIFIVSCHQKERTITLQEAENKVLLLPLTQKVNRYIDNFSQGKHGVSILSDSLLIENEYFYQVQIGYDSPIRYETYYTLYVNKRNEADIRIMEPISGEIIPLSQWKEDTSYENLPNEKKNDLSCDELLTHMVQSSNITLIVASIDCYVVQDRVEQDNIYAGVYTSTEGDSRTMVLAWVRYNVTDAKLYDITKDSDQPIELTFDKKLLEGYDFESQCGIVSPMQ